MSNNSTSGNILKGNENTNSKMHQHPHIQNSIIYNGQDIKTT